jgi:hypothetical protein
MASVPGPDPDAPLPKPAAPALDPEHENEDDERLVAAPERDVPEWMPEPYHPDREIVEPSLPLAVP